MELLIKESTDGTLNGITLQLDQIYEMRYKCRKTGLEIMDTWDEVPEIRKSYLNTGTIRFWDMHTFAVTKEGLVFIGEVEVMP